MRCALIVFIAGLVFSACGSSVGLEGEYVGGACAADTDCSADSRCFTKDDFPGGTCSIVCTKHEDCPDDTRCIEKEGGMCLLTCELPGDCRGGYTCKGVKNQFGGGESLVCVK